MLRYIHLDKKYSLSLKWAALENFIGSPPAYYTHVKTKQTPLPYVLAHKRTTLTW